MSVDRDIDALLDEVVTLPSLSATVTRIIEMVNRPNCEISEVAKVISGDPAIALKILRLINSAYYGLAHRIVSIEHAVAMLGLDVVRNLVFTTAVFDTLQSSVEQFTRHSVACAIAMRTLVEAGKEATRTVSPDEAFVFGLLHDVGKLIFEQFLPKSFAQVLVMSQAREAPWYEIERETIGTDHGTMGARLVKYWNLPQELTDGIVGHHDLSKCSDPSNRGIAALLSVADYVCSTCDFPAYPNAVVIVPEEIWAVAHFTKDDAGPIEEQFLESAPFVEELANLSA